MKLSFKFTVDLPEQCDVASFFCSGSFLKMLTIENEKFWPASDELAPVVLTSIIFVGQPVNTSLSKTWKLDGKTFSSRINNRFRAKSTAMRIPILRSVQQQRAGHCEITWPLTELLVELLQVPYSEPSLSETKRILFSIVTRRMASFSSTSNTFCCCATSSRQIYVLAVRANCYKCLVS